MPITKSAKKAQRQALSREAANKGVKQEMRTAIRALEKSTGKSKEEASLLLSASYKKIDKAAKIGIIKRNAAARKKSRLYKKIKSRGASQD